MDKKKPISDYLHQDYSHLEMAEMTQLKKKYSSLEEKIRDNLPIKVEEKTRGSDSHCGKVFLAFPSAKTGLFFYHIPLSERGKEEDEREFVLCNYLQKQGICVPTPLSREDDIYFYRLVPGREFLDVLQEDNEKNRDMILTDIIQQVFRYHSLVLSRDAKKALQKRPLHAYYSIGRFFDLIDPEKKKLPLQDDIKVQWEQCIDNPLAEERQGLIHNDLNSRNILVSGQEPMLVDWADATIGSVHYDICRILWDSGYTFLHKEENIPRLMKFIPQEALTEYGGEERFYHALRRAYPSVLLRITGSNYRLLKKIRNNKKYCETLSEADKKFYENMPSFLFTLSCKVLEEEGLSDLAKQLKLLGGNNSDIRFIGEKMFNQLAEQYSPHVHQQLHRKLQNVGSEKDSPFSFSNTYNLTIGSLT